MHGETIQKLLKIIHLVDQQKTFYVIYQRREEWERLVIWQVRMVPRNGILTALTDFSILNLKF
jgi:hypothetical protein